MKQPTIEQQVARIRARIAEVRVELVAMLAQTRSRAEVAEMFEAMLERWAAQGREVLMREMLRLANGQPGVPLTIRGDAASTLDLGPMLVALMGRDAIRSALVPTLASIPEGWPAASRHAHIAELNAEADRLERQEEALIDESDATDSPIARRADARPDIVLAN